MLQEAREAGGLTQQDLAEQVGVTQPQIARWETGEREPRVRVAVRLAEVLGTTANAIWAVEDGELGDPHEQKVPRTYARTSGQLRLEKRQPAPGRDDRKER